jgi:hypothetical protein
MKKKYHNIEDIETLETSKDLNSSKCNVCFEGKEKE